LPRLAFTLALRHAFRRPLILTARRFESKRKQTRWRLPSQRQGALTIRNGVRGLTRFADLFFAEEFLCGGYDVVGFEAEFSLELFERGGGAESFHAG
jgi:hypothetical protein